MLGGLSAVRARRDSEGAACPRGERMKGRLRK